MIITRTPFRISFVGGGTDLPVFYREHGGAVAATAIDKYVYITVNKAFCRKIRVSYSRTEIVDDVSDVQHPLVREAMKLTGVTEGVEITSIADIPSQGTGLGSSSSYTVGLLKALWAYRGKLKSSWELAEEACRIEMDFLQEPIGKQDQYIAAFGGLKYMEFQTDDSVLVEPLLCPSERLENLARSLMLFYTGLVRSSRDILSRQRREAPGKTASLRRMKELAREMKDGLLAGADLSLVGGLLHENWELKRRLAPGITSPEIDAFYERGIRAGALGGKLLGAGGGGFLLFYVPYPRQPMVREALADLREIPFRMEPQGSAIIYTE